MSDTFRAMCAELVDVVDLLCGSGYSPGQPLSRLILTVHVEALEELAVRARALLAQPEPEGLTEQELWQIWDDIDSTIPDILRAAIAADRARYGRPIPTPEATND